MTYNKHSVFHNRGNLLAQIGSAQRWFAGQKVRDFWGRSGNQREPLI